MKSRSTDFQKPTKNYGILQKIRLAANSNFVSTFVFLGANLQNKNKIFNFKLLIFGHYYIKPKGLATVSP